MPTTRLTPVCHRTIGQPRPAENPNHSWRGPFSMTSPCAGSRCALHVRVKSATDPRVALMRCAENEHGEPWLDPNAPQPARREVAE